MLLLTTTDADGETNDRMLARFETDGKIYQRLAHHWPRGWYHSYNNLAVQAEIDGITLKLHSGTYKRRWNLRGSPPIIHCHCRRTQWASPPRDILRLDLHVPIGRTAHRYTTTFCQAFTRLLTLMPT